MEYEDGTRAAPTRKRWSVKKEPQIEENTGNERNPTGSKGKDVNAIQQLIKAVTGKRLKNLQQRSSESEKSNDDGIQLPRPPQLEN